MNCFEITMHAPDADLQIYRFWWWEGVGVFRSTSKLPVMRGDHGANHLRYDLVLMGTFGQKNFLRFRAKQYDPNPRGLGSSFLLLIMSKAYPGLILCKVFDGAGRYERTVDFGNDGENGLLK
jgi:hypothetical protein